MTDDQGYGQLGCQGHPWLETPHLDALHAESLSFTSFYVSPTCSPTRAALMTGNVPFKGGVTHTTGARHRLALSAVTLPQYLKKAGYTSGIFGKWHLGLEEEYQPGARGFDEVFVHGYGAIGQGLDVPVNKGKYYNPVLRHNGRFVQTKGFCTDIFFSQALAWIKHNRGRPFFAYISTNAPHGPFIPPKDKKAKFFGYGFKPNQQGFYGMIENIDENMGRLISRLKEWELEEKTLVVFMSDNGFVLGGLGEGKLGTRNGKPLSAFTAGLKGGKGTVNEGGTLVPAFFRWKGVLREGVETKALSAHIDVLPTLVELAGGEVPGDLDGKSLVPLLKNPNAKWADRKLFFHRGRWKDSVGPDESKYDKARGKGGFAVRNSRYRLVNNEELYDILTDPGETKNIYDQKPEVAGEMQQAYNKWWDEVRPHMVNEGRAIGVNPYHVNYREQLEQKGIPSWQKPEL